MKQKSALFNAIKELEKEIGILNRERDFLKKAIEKTSTSISESRRKEVELQKILTNIAEKEAKLQEHKKSLQTQSDKVSDKLGKMSKIKSEMKDI